jgi:hypothetical protein
MEADETRNARHHRTLHAHAADGIHAVENDEFFLRKGGGLEGDAERGGVGVEAGADVLDIENKGVEVAELLRLGRVGPENGGGVVGVGLAGRAFRGVAVEAVNREFGFFVDGVADFFVGRPADAVLGAEEGDEFEVFRGVEQIDGAAAVAVAAAVVGDETDAQAAKAGFTATSASACSQTSSASAPALRPWYSWPLLLTTTRRPCAPAKASAAETSAADRARTAKGGMLPSAQGRCASKQSAPVVMSCSQFTSCCAPGSEARKYELV